MVAKYCPWFIFVIFYFLIGLLKVTQKVFVHLDWLVLGIEEATENSHLVRTEIFLPSQVFIFSRYRTRQLEK